jgi:MoaA/NifB/PqqE/SkfB family radical SAM enzyme
MLRSFPATSRSINESHLDFDEPADLFYEDAACDPSAPLPARVPPDPHPDELSAESIRLIDQLGIPGSPDAGVYGGDRSNGGIFALCEYAVGMDLDVSITPSATPLVMDSAIRRLRGAGISRLAISLDGADAATHDRIRGVSGSFERSLQILRQSAYVGLTSQVNTTLTPSNFDQIDRLAELLATLDIQMWSVFFLVPTGRARFAARLSAEECEAAFAKLWRHSRQQSYAIKTTEAPHYRRWLR